MKYRRFLLTLVIVTQLASSGCMLFGRRDCCGERRGLFGFLTRNRAPRNAVPGGGFDYGAPCSTCPGDFPGMPVSGGPMLAPPGPPDERLGAPAANRPWEGPGAAPAPLPKTNQGNR